MPEEQAKKISENDLPVLEKKEVQNMFVKWNKALATLKPDKVAELYHSDAVLLPTVSDVPRTTTETIRDYFVTFLQNEPQGKILESYVTSGKGWCKDVGVYEFKMKGSEEPVKARYSFLYMCQLESYSFLYMYKSALFLCFDNLVQIMIDLSIHNQLTH